ncbi:MAG: flagellar motor switch protein FliG, partial [Candidatus Eisenbacteria bacterium]|nr:flagellar motor switch protein FliG [Candidatus Eisenbacteria bacterium]
MALGSLTGPQKAALVLVTVGTDTAAKIFRFLPHDEVEQLVAEVANLGEVPPETRTGVLGEFEQLARANQYITEGGVDIARQILVQALGSERANEIMERLHAKSAGDVFHMKMLNRVDPKQLVTFIQGEHPQTIALILSHLNSSKASEILAGLGGNKQMEVIK